MNAGNKNTPSMHHPRIRKVTTSMVGLKTVTEAKISPKMVKPRDIAGDTGEDTDDETVWIEPHRISRGAHYYLHPSVTHTDSSKQKWKTKHKEQTNTIYTRTYTHARLCTHAHACHACDTHTHAHTHTHTHTHTQPHTQNYHKNPNMENNTNVFLVICVERKLVSQHTLLRTMSAHSVYNGGMK